jgi:hypothetical protein
MSRLAQILVLIVAATAGVVVACSTGTEDSGKTRRTTVLAEPDDVLSEELMLPLAQAKNFHRKADVYLQDGDVVGAIAAVREVLSVSFPADSAEGQEVLLDARARLAKLLVTSGAVDEAMAVVDAGIAGATRDSYFLGNLYTVKGEVHEARAVLLDDTDRAAATTERKAAITALDRANEIYVARQKQLLGEVAP